MGTMLLVAACSTAACVDAPEVELGSTAGESFEAFRARSVTADGMFLIERDVVVSDEAALYDEWSARQHGALMIARAGGQDNRWSPANQRALTYCVSLNFGTHHGHLVDAMHKAAGGWESTADVDFIYRPQEDAACNVANPNVVFSVESADLPFPTAATAFYPNAAKPTRRLKVSYTFEPDIDFGVLGHELGHILGFRHEHDRVTYDPNPSDSQACDEEGHGDARDLSPYDAYSIMHYVACRADGTGDQRWTHYDRSGSRSVYGVPRQPADLLWRNATHVSIWRMSAYPGELETWDVATVQDSTTSNASWRVATIANFNGADGQDVLWRHQTTGQLKLWLMQASQRTAIDLAIYPDNEWQVQGAGDFNGDGYADILWRHTNGGLAIWMMQGATVLAQTWPVEVPGNEWQIRGVGDADGDGKADILWSSNTNAVAVWMMNGATHVATKSFQLPAGAQIAGMADFDRDRRADVLVRYANGGIVWWMLKGTGPVEYSNGSSTSPGPEWQIAGVGDYNADKSADIVWRNSTTRVVTVWLSNPKRAGQIQSAQPSQQLASSTIPGPEWQIQGVGQFD